MSQSPQNNTLINAAQNPTGRNLQEMAQLPIQNISIPDSARQLGQAAFESQVEPLRRGFGERLEQTAGELSRRGIAFGGATGPGAKQVRKLMETQSDLESQVAGQVGSQLGMTLLDQAFQSSEMAKRFEESKEYATFTQGLKFGTNEQGQPITQLEAQKQIADFTSDLDIETQRQLGELNLTNQKSLFEFTTGLEGKQKKDFADFMANLDLKTKMDFLKYSTDLDITSKKDLATFMTDLDTVAQKDMATFLSDLNTEQTKTLTEWTANLDQGMKKDFAEFMSGLEMEDRKEFLEFSTELDSDTKKDLAVFMTGLETIAQKDIAQFVSKLDTQQAKDLATFTSDLDYDNKEKFTNYLQKIKGGVDDNGNPLTDVQIAEKMSDISTKANETMMKLSRGTNPDTGAAYTDVDMANIAADLEINRAERQSDINKDLASYAASLDRGTDDDGNPLTMTDFNEIQARMTNRLQNEFAQKAFEEAAIAEYGANGVEIANQLANTRGESMKDDLSLLEAVEADTGFTDSQKQELTGLILSGAGWESEPVKNIIENSDSNVVALDFMRAPDPKTTLEGASSELKDYLAKRGFGYESDGGWQMDTDQAAVDKFNDLWETNPEFRRQVGRG